MPAGPSRRCVLAALGGTALTGGLLGSLPAGRAAAAQGFSPVLRSPLLFYSPPLTPFVDDLPRLPVVSGNRIELDARTTLHRFHRDLTAVPAMGYGGRSYLGPVIEAHRGQPTTLLVRNRLGRHPFAADLDPTVHGALESDRYAPRTITHLHGAPSPPDADGHPQTAVPPGYAVTHVYPNDQAATTVWYHDHTMGLTRLNVYAGLAGPYLVRDRWDTGRADNPLGLPAGEYEVPLALQEKIFNSDGTMSMRSTPIVPQGSWEGGAVGDVGLVNGAVWPVLDVDRGLYRFRILNAGSYSFWRLFLSTGLPFWVIGNDGGLLDRPVRTRRLGLGPGERIDVLVDFSSLDPGDVVELRNDDPAPLQAAVIGEVAMPVFCRFRATAHRGFRGPVPNRLRGGRNRPAVLPPLPKPARHRTVSVNELVELRLPPALMNLNNLRYTDPDVEMPKQGVVEQWDIVNTTTDPHPIHLHLVQFRILGRQPYDLLRFGSANPRPPLGVRWAPSADAFTTGRLVPPAPWEAGWKDTVRCEGQSITRILVRFPTAQELGFDPDAPFAAPAGAMAMPAATAADPMGTGTQQMLRGYVWHCHILDHEDHEMMLRYRIVR